MHHMIKRFYGQGGPQKLKPANGIPSYQNPESITARIVRHSKKIARCQLDEWSAFRPCGRDLVHRFNSTSWAFPVNLT